MRSFSFTVGVDPRDHGGLHSLRGPVGEASACNVFQGEAGLAKPAPGGPPAPLNPAPADLGARPASLPQNNCLITTAQNADEIKPSAR